MEAAGRNQVLGRRINVQIGAENWIEIGAGNRNRIGTGIKNMEELGSRSLLGIREGIGSIVHKLSTLEKKREGEE